MEVSYSIRLDVASAEERGKMTEKLGEVKGHSESAIKAFKLESAREITERCTDEENGYFEKIKTLVDDSEELSYHPGKVGFSVKKNSIPIIWCYPITASTPNNLIFHRDNLAEKSLGFLKVKKADMNRKRIPLSIPDVPVEELIDFLSNVEVKIS